MRVTGIKCPKCKQVVWPKVVNKPVYCWCGYCYIEHIFRGQSNHARIGYGDPGAKMAVVPLQVIVDKETGEVVS